MGKGIIKKRSGIRHIRSLPSRLEVSASSMEKTLEQRTGQQFEFLSTHPLKRIVTVVMGPLFNLLFGILVFFVMGARRLYKDARKSSFPKICSPANWFHRLQRRLKNGDRMRKIGEREVQSFADIRRVFCSPKGRSSKFAFKRDDRVLSVSVPRRLENGRYEIGVMPYGKKILVIDRAH